MEHFSYKGVTYVNICILKNLKEELAWAIDKWLWDTNVIKNSYTTKNLKNMPF